LIIGTIARLSDEKDYPTLFNAFKVVLEVNPSSTLRIAGEGPLESELKSLAMELGIHTNIIWEGKISDVPSFLEEIDIFVLASKFEGFGMVLVEAMCMTKPIVAAGNSAILEVLGNNGAGTFFETGNSKSLVSKIFDAQEANLIDYAGEQNLRLLEFSTENLAKHTTKLYERVANGPL